LRRPPLLCSIRRVIPLDGPPDRLTRRLGRALANRYALEGELPRVGAARVFRATETAFGRAVVLKVLPPEIAGALEDDRFEREIQLAASIQHPHIVPILAAGNVDGVPWYAMPFIEGESLHTRLARTGRFGVVATLRMLREVTTALEAAHARGIVHRDIKPDNILFAGDVAIVTDFGVAKALRNAALHGDPGTLTRSGFVVGTPAYMAPEQAAGDRAVDGRADIYALGCVAFEALVGQPPFAARTIPGLLAAQITQAAPLITDFDPRIPPVVAALIARCLAKAPDDRPTSASVLRQQLDEISMQSAASLTPERSVTPVAPPAVDLVDPDAGGAAAPATSRSLPLLLVVLVAVALLVVAAVGVFG
jgi:serine/threonine-protein kinase